MKKTLIITAIALATTGMALNATAQGPKFNNAANCPTANCPAPDCPMAAAGGMKGGGPGYHRGAGRMMNGLNLTDAQKAQVHDIMAQQREETHAKIRAVLTPEQQALFDARKQQRDARFEQRMGGF
ncbi:MAG: Spy/CpxP family protein refolding chaperone [Burkholderiales bacterium]|jgi:Spy/CpxP family protein refolding chaperone|nr:Spy/CpxP family protein refolding chaperone [Burkholderiales bacterium]